MLQLCIKFTIFALANVKYVSHFCNLVVFMHDFLTTFGLKLNSFLYQYFMFN